MSRTGNLYVVSAPSGTGKTTLCHVIMSSFDNIGYSISHTTRNPRDGESHGVDYYFTPKEDFEIMIKDDSLAEWAEVHGNYYGTSVEFLEENLKAGYDVLLDIDVNGAKQIVKKFPDAVTIFIMPPSVETLRERLLSRATDSLETIEKRLNNAKDEIAEKDFYRHIVVNDDLNVASTEMKELIKKYRVESKYE